MNNDNKVSNSPKTGILSKANSYRKRFPILFNLLLIGLTGLVIVWLLMCFLNSWTLHGNEQIIPDVKGQNIHIALGNLEKEGMGGIIADSIFDTSSTAGTVVDQNPKPGSKVKPGRTVYLTIVAYSPKMVTVPSVVNTSLRQGQSMLQGAGFRQIMINRVPSEYEDLVLAVKYNGRELRQGEKVPINSVIVLEVGSGFSEDEAPKGDNNQAVAE